MSLQAKFKCEKVEHFDGSRRAFLRPVTATSEENKTYSAYTPSGALEMAISNPAAFDFYKPGREYVLDIKEVPLPGEEVAIKVGDMVRHMGLPNISEMEVIDLDDTGSYPAAYCEYLVPGIYGKLPKQERFRLLDLIKIES